MHACVEGVVVVFLLSPQRAGSHYNHLYIGILSFYSKYFGFVHRTLI